MSHIYKILPNLLVLLALFMALVRPAVQAEPAIQAATYSISGRVTDSKGDGVFGAVV